MTLLGPPCWVHSRCDLLGPFREFIPVGEQKVRIHLPDGARAMKVRFLVADRRPRTERRGQELTVTVPSILDHEVVAIDF